MQEPLACRSASAKNVVACRGLRVGPSQVCPGYVELHIRPGCPGTRPQTFPGALRRHTVRSEKLQNESSPNFSNFRPGFSPEFSSEFSPKVLRIFVLCFPGNGDHENSPKITAIFQCQIPSQIRKKYSQFFWRGGKVTYRPETPGRINRGLPAGVPGTCCGFFF